MKFAWFYVLIQLCMSEEDLIYPSNSLNSPGSLYYFPNQIPIPRIHHTVNILDPFVIVYGGSSAQGTLLNDINIYDLRYQRWSGSLSVTKCCTIQGETVETIGQERNLKVQDLDIGYEGGFPSARAEHASTTSSKMLFIFGGVTEFGLMNDFFTFDPSAIKWKSVLRSSGSWPQRRAGHSLNYLEEKLILFGGRGESRVGTGIGLAHSLNDVWIYETTSGRWLETESFTSSKNKVTPSGRQHAATCVYAGNLWVFGGVDYTTHITYNDLWSFDINSYQWTMRSPNSGHVNGFSPPPLHHAHLLPNVESDLSNAGLLVYGGVGSGGSCGGWKCNASQLVIGQLYRFDTAVGEWGSERVAGSGLGGSQADVQSCTWKFARISNSNDWSMGGSGKYEKNHVLEGAAVSVERKLLFDFGGVLTPPDATNEMPTTAHATQERYGQGKEYHSAGGLLKNGPWDLYTGEQLRESVDIPVRKSFWPLVDVDERPLHETEYVRFAKQLSQFTMASQDVVLLSVSEFE